VKQFTEQNLESLSSAAVPLANSIGIVRKNTPSSLLLWSHRHPFAYTRVGVEVPHLLVVHKLHALRGAALYQGSDRVGQSARGP
jgi:hypothetical protein